MVAAAVFLVTLTIAALLGLMIYRWRRGRRLTILWTIGSVLISGFLFILSGTVYLYYALAYPALNHFSLAQRDALDLRFGMASAPTVAGTPSEKTPGDAGSRIIFRPTFDAGVGVDFRIYLRVVPVTATGQIQVELDAPSSWEVRTTDICSPPRSLSASKLVSACGIVVDGVFEASWTVTPSSAATSLSTIVLPAELRPRALHGDNWRAYPYVNGSALTWLKSSRSKTEFLPPDSPHPWPHGSSAEAALQAVVVLDTESPKLAYKGYDIDLSRGRLSTQTTVVQTLGVSAESYAWLAVIGTILTTALGSGWLIQLLSWVAKLIGDRSTKQASN